MHQGYIDPNFPNPHGPDDASIIIYGYTPSTPLAVLGISLFSLLLLLLSIQVSRFRLWSYLPIIVGCVLEVIGYSFRYLSSHVDPYRITFFIIQYFCITVAPVFLSASVYIYLTSFTRWASARNYDTGFVQKLGHRAILWIFITADTVCTLLQVTGASLIGVKTSHHDDPKKVNYILIAGLAAQTIAFSIFLVLIASLTVSTCRHQKARSHQLELIVKRGIFTLVSSGVLIFVRTVFRLCESAQGVFGYLSSHEVFFGTLEFSPVVVAVGVLTIWTPAIWKAQHTRRVSAFAEALSECASEHSDEIYMQNFRA